MFTDIADFSHKKNEYQVYLFLKLDFVHFLASRSPVLPWEQGVFNLNGMVEWPFLKIKNRSDSLEPPGRCSQKMYKVELSDNNRKIRRKQCLRLVKLRLEKILLLS